MSIRNSIISIVGLFIFSISHAQDFQWVKEREENSRQKSKLAITEDNDLILAENFKETISIGNRKIKSKGGNDFIITKYDSKGRVVWIQQFGGLRNEEIKDIAGDQNGNIFITGNFSEDISIGEVKLSSIGKDDVFLAKLDKKGNCQWAISYGDKGLDLATCMTLSKEGEPIIAGSLDSNSAIKSDSIYYGFISKYDRSGKQLWNKKFQSADGRTESKVIVNNTRNEIIIAGIFYDNLLFENTSLFVESPIIEDLSNLYLVSLDKNGNINWSNHLSSVDFDSFISMESALACDEQDNIYLGASFIGSINIGDTYYSASGIGNQDIFLASCTRNGSWKWVHKSEGDDSNYGRDNIVAIKSHENGNLYCTGYFDGVLKWGGIILSENKEIYDSDIFIVSIDSTGNFLWGKQAGAATSAYFTFDDDVSDLAVNDKEEIYLSGNTNGNAKFDKIQLKFQGKKTSYFAKISKSGKSLMKEMHSVQDSIHVTIYPNPSLSEEVTVKMEGTGEKCKVTLHDNLGNMVMQLYQGKTKKKEVYQFIIKSSELQEGMYHVKLLSNDILSSYKLIISK